MKKSPILATINTRLSQRNWSWVSILVSMIGDKISAGMAAGVRRLEVGDFVRSKWILFNSTRNRVMFVRDRKPEMRDARCAALNYALELYDP